MAKTVSLVAETVNKEDASSFECVPRAVEVKEPALARWQLQESAEGAEGRPGRHGERHEACVAALCNRFN